MGKKKGKGKKKAAPPPVTQPPFSFHIDDFPADSGNCSLHLNDTIDVRFREIEIEVKIVRDPETGKRGYDLKVVKVKEEVRPHGVYYPEELLPFPIVFLETGQTLRVEPLRTGGQQPFLMIDPDTNLEKLIEPPYFVHYELTNRKRYVLNMRKFVGGKFKFKDPETKEEIIVDITKRVDPLSGLPLYGDYENPERQFVETLRDGELYIVKDPDTGGIQVLDVTGQPALDYHSQYDPDTNTTSIVDEQGDILTTLEGNYPIQLALPGDLLEELMSGEEEGDEIEDKDGKLTDKQERPEDKSLLPVDRQGRDTQADATDMLNEVTSQLVPRLTGYHMEPDPASATIRLVDQHGNPVQLPPGYRIELDSSGAMQLINEHGDRVDLTTLGDSYLAECMGNIPSGYGLARDPNTGHIVLVTRSGHVVQYPETGDIDLTESQRRIIHPDLWPSSSNISQLPDSSKAFDTVDTDQRPPGLKLFGDSDTKPKPEEETYFEQLKTEEGWSILNEMKHVEPATRKKLLTHLIEAIEFEKEFVNCAMSAKLDEERKFTESFMKDKELRQSQFIADLLQRHQHSYDQHEVEVEVVYKLNRENEYIFDKLNEKIKRENLALSQALETELRTNRTRIIAQTNRACYQKCKRILYKYFAEKLAQEIKHVREEFCIRLTNERNAILRDIAQYYKR
ncbi:hypothetical protein M8J77_013685 [Diaphorina citri]|nr:hypothetical protein M8J77_013685 [Diaphorina citri]